MDPNLGLYICAGLYLLFLLGVAIVSAVANKDKESSVESHYLAGRSFGPVVLFFTLFATLFSGYTVVGVPSEAFVAGFLSFRWIILVLVTGVSNLILLPRTRKLGIVRNYTSGGEFLKDRYRDKVLHRLGASLFLIVPTWLYLSAQFFAMGSTISVLTGGALSPIAGAACLAVLILLYEMFGGMRAVAWTDCMQGIMLIFGFVALGIVLESTYGPWANVLPAAVKAQPTIVYVPSGEMLSQLFAFAFVFGMSFPLYPHVSSRIYSAKNNKGIRVALSVLTFSWVLTMLPGIFLGVYGIAVFGEDTTVTRATFFGAVMQELMLKSVGNYIICAILLTCSLAAIMSTADSCLMGVGTVFTCDIMREIKPDASDKTLLMAGKACSLVSSVVGVALMADPNAVSNLSALAAFQASILIQLYPAYSLGLYFKGLRSGAVLTGLIVGMLLTLYLQFGMDTQLLLPGMWGFFGNMVVVGIMQLVLSCFPELPQCCAYAPESCARYGPDRLDQDKVEEIMAGTREPIFAWWIMAPLCLITVFSATPFWMKPLSPSPTVAGVPSWFLAVLIMCAFGSALCVYGYWYWLEPDEEDVKAVPDEEEGPETDETTDMIKEQPEDFPAVDPAESVTKQSSEVPDNVVVHTTVD